MRLAVSHRRAVNDYAKPPRRQAEDESADADSESADSIDHVIGTGKVVDTDDEASAGSFCASTPRSAIPQSGAMAATSSP